MDFVDMITNQIDCTGGKIDGEILTDLLYADSIAILSETVPHLTDITR